MLVYILTVFTFTLQNTLVTIQVRVNSGPKTFIFVPKLRDTYWGVIDKEPNCFSNYCTKLIL